MDAANRFDLVVAGAGCAGLATALFAALRGLRVVVLERSPWIGGTSALSAGALWIPNTALAAGSGDSPEAAALYLAQATAGRTPAALRERFLALGPEAVHVLQRDSAVRLRAFAHHPDYLSTLPGATRHGRVLECLPFDGRLLGDDFARLRPPLPGFTVLGGMMVDRIDIGHLLQLLQLRRSPASALHAARLLLRHAQDRLHYPRGTRLVMGNALVGRLLLSLRERGVPVWTGTEADHLRCAGDRVVGVSVLRGGERLELHARCGVVLAGGGFNDHAALRRRLIPAAVTASPRAGSSPGLLLAQALALGARLGDADGSAAHWAPVSVHRRDDGTQAVFPHFVLDRAKPGTLMVDPTGRRFANESLPYHLLGERLLAQRGPAHAWLIADRRAFERYGLGLVRPGGLGAARLVRAGYVHRAPSLEALAGALGIDAAVLQATVARFNGFAPTGVDTDFQRGSTDYERQLGDPAVGPNPTLGSLVQPPFHAVRLQPGDIAAATGLVTDADARVLRDGLPIPGLFAVGDDMQSVVGSAYPGPGIHLGPALVFAYAAARAAA